MYGLVEKNILNKNLIKENDNILIGFSGGPDSVFLFHKLRLLKETLSYNLYASHINHMYRGADADRDEDFVRKLCEKYNITFFVKRKNATEYANELKITEEEAGRILRYDFFRENLREIGGGKIAVAHNLNDQAETIMQRIIRGTGVDGLSAMTYMKGDIIRPILNVQRQDIEKYLQENNYEFCTDKTNSQPIYGRNKIRLNLIPYLKESFNPNIENTLFRMSEVMESDSKIIEKYTDMKFQEVLIKKTQNSIYLDLCKLKKIENYETGRIIKKSIEELKGNTNNIEVKHINYANEFINNGKTGKKINLSEGLLIEISYNNFILRKDVEKFPKFEYTIEDDKPMFIKEINKTIICKILDVSSFGKLDNKDICLDYHKVIGSIIVRNRKNGDSIVPCGMTGNKKIKDIFTDLKIPLEQRDKKLIITDDENILWVEGFRIHNSYKISSFTKKILNICIKESHNE